MTKSPQVRTVAEEKLPAEMPGHWDTPEGLSMATEYLGKQRADLCKDDVSDLALANAVFMASRTDLDLIVWQTAAKERIRWLSAQLVRALSKQVRSGQRRPIVDPAWSLEDRFWPLVAKSGPDECWEWQGKRAVWGYGLIANGGRRHGAHRISWALANGRMPSRTELVRHTCDNPPCVNPAHLLLGTNADNNADQISRGRHYLQRRTHCLKAGHPLSGDNLFLARGKSGNVARVCRACRKLRDHVRNSRPKS